MRARDTKGISEQHQRIRVTVSIEEGPGPAAANILRTVMASPTKMFLMNTSAPKSRRESRCFCQKTLQPDVSLLPKNPPWLLQLTW